MAIPFLSPQTKRLLQIARAKFYDDEISLRFLSGSSIADPESLRPLFTTADGTQIEDAWGRPEVNEANFTVVSGEVMIPGTFSWGPTIDRRFLPLGLSEDAEALFACSKEFYSFFSGPHTFIVRDDVQLEVGAVTKDLTTDEIYVVLKKIREDDTGEST